MQYNDVTFDHILTKGAVAPLQAQEDYIALQAFNVIPVEGDKFTYKYYDKNNMTSDDVKERHTSAHYPRVSHNVITKTGVCKDYGLESAVDRKLQKELGGSVLQTESDILFQKGLIRMEKKMFEVFFADSAYGTALVGGTDFTKWDDPTSNPIGDIMDEIRNVARKSGVKPNSITCTADVADALLQNQEIIDRMPTDRMRVLDYSDLATVFKVKYFNVSQGVSSADEATDPDLIETKKLLIHHKADGDPRVKANSGIIAISNTAQDVVGTNGIGITRYFEPQTRSDVLGLDMNCEMTIPAAYTGKLFKDCIA